MNTSLATVSKSDIEMTVAAIWEELFKRSAFSADDEFFKVGGNSLLAVKFLAKIEKQFGLDALTPEDLYERPRLADIVATIHRNAAA